MAVRPFQFTGLPRFSREQVALQQSMACYLSFKPFRPRFRHTLADMLGNYLKVPCEISGAELRPINRYEIGAMLPEIACLILLGTGPTGRKLLVELDPSLAVFAIERLLGGTGDSDRMRRPLTEIEEGVLSFLVLKVLTHFQDGWETGREAPLTLEHFGSALDAFQELVDGEPLYQMVGFRVAAGRKTGYVRILIPQSMVTTTFASLPAQSGTTDLELGYMRRLLAGLGQRPVTARLEIARLDLPAEDRGHLERGDIIVLENHQIALTRTGISGQVFGRVGRGSNGGFEAQVMPHADHVRLRVTQIVQQEQPLEGSMGSADEYGDHGDADDGMDAAGAARDPQASEQDNLQETEGLLRDVEAPVVVELGRVRMNTAQVVRLRAGQVLRLNRGPNDPVALVVNGKMFARGELVEIDGELGVRLLQVVGAG